MNELIAPLPPEVALDPDSWETAFKKYLHEGLSALLKPLGFKGLAIAGKSSNKWNVVALLGDGTPITVTGTSAELSALEPNGELDVQPFADLCIDFVFAKILAGAERARGKQEEAANPVKLGVLAHDGFTGLEIGEELRHILGDAAYELDAEIKGEVPRDGDRITNLNPARSTPGRNDAAIAVSRAMDRRGP